MDSLTNSVVATIARYALDKGAELGKAAGEKAREAAEQMFQAVLEQIEKVDPRVAQRFPQNPQGYQAPLADALDETLQIDPDLTARLQALLAQYEQAAKAHAAETGTSYDAHLTGSGAIAQGTGATAAGEGGLAVGGNVGGDVVLGNKQTGVDQRGQQVGTQYNIYGQAAGAAPLDPGLTEGWNVEAIRQMLMAAFSDGELTTLCFDRFQAVYENFGGGVSKGDKVRQLMDYCFRQGQMDVLLAEVERRNPAQYRRFAGGLRT